MHQPNAPFPRQSARTGRPQLRPLATNSSATEPRAAFTAFHSEKDMKMNANVHVQPDFDGP